MPYPDLGMQSPVWTSSSLGAIGSERGALTMPSHCQGSQSQRQSGQTKLGGRQYHDNPSGHHNVVDVGRIRDVHPTYNLYNHARYVQPFSFGHLYDDRRALINACTKGVSP